MSEQLLAQLATQTTELGEYVDLAHRKLGQDSPTYRSLRTWYERVWTPWFTYYARPDSDDNTALADVHDTIYPSARTAGFPDRVLTLPDIDQDDPNDLPPQAVATGASMSYHPSIGAQGLTLPEFAACCAVELRAGDQLYVCCAIRDPRTGGMKKFERVVDLSGLTRSIAAKLARWHADEHGLPPLPGPDPDTGDEPTQEEIEAHFREAGFEPDGSPVEQAPTEGPVVEGSDDTHPGQTQAVMIAGPLDFLATAANAAQGIATSAATRNLFTQVAPLVVPGLGLAMTLAQQAQLANTVADARAGVPAAQQQVNQVVAQAAVDPRAAALAEQMRIYADALDHKAAGGQLPGGPAQQHFIDQGFYPSAYQKGVKTGQLMGDEPDSILNILPFVQVGAAKRVHGGKPNRGAPQVRNAQQVARGQAQQDARRQRNLDNAQAKLDRLRAAHDYQDQMSDYRSQSDQVQQQGGGGGGGGGGDYGGGYQDPGYDPGYDPSYDQGYGDDQDPDVWSSGVGRPRSLYDVGMGR